MEYAGYEWKVCRVIVVVVAETVAIASTGFVDWITNVGYEGPNVALGE